MDAETQNKTGLIHTKEPVSTEQLISEIENNVTYSDTFSNIVSDAEKILCILAPCDNPLTEYVLSKIADSGKPYTVMFATAGFEPLSTEDKQKLCGGAFEKVSDNIADNTPEQMGTGAFFGITKSKTPVFINKAFLEAETVITLGHADNDPFYGLTGGPLLVFPGISTHKAIGKNALVGFEAVHGFSGRNPVYDDCVDACVISRAGKTYFSINTLRDAEKNTFGVIAGDLFMAHKLAMNKASKLMSDDVPERVAVDAAGKSTADVLRAIEQGASAGGQVYIKNCGEFANSSVAEKASEISESYGEAVVNSFSPEIFLAARLAHASKKAELFCLDTEGFSGVFSSADSSDLDELPPLIRI